MFKLQEISTKRSKKRKKQLIKIRKGGKKTNLQSLWIQLTVCRKMLMLKFLFIREIERR